MKLNTFLQKTSNMKAENRLLKFIILIIGVAVIINTFMLQRALNSQQEILVPPVIDSRIAITGDKASDEYIRSFTRYITTLALSYSPATARSQFDELIVMYAPEAFPSAKKTFYDLADTIETTKVTGVFYIQGIKIDGSKSQIEVTGLRRQFVEDKKIDEAPKTYHINYKISNRKFMILKFSEKEG